MSSDPDDSLARVPLVSLVVVTRNGREHIGSCLESVFSLDYPAERVEVFVVDNGSSDGSDQFVKKHFPLARWLVNDANNYCRANNLALSQAAGSVVGFLNNDVRLDRCWLRELVPVMERMERIGGVTGKLLLPDGRINSTGHVELPHGVWADRGFLEPDVQQFDVASQVPGLSGAAALYKRQCLEEVGLFDEDFHMYYEDIDLALRCAQRGWKLLYVPSAIAYHTFHGTATARIVREQTARNHLLLLAKHWPERLAPALAMSPAPTDDAARPSMEQLLRDLPAVTKKLFRHHGAEGLLHWLPGIYEELGKLIQLERQRLPHQAERWQQHSEQLERELRQTRKALEGSLKKSERTVEELKTVIHRMALDHAEAVTRAEERQSVCDRLWRQLRESEDHVPQLKHTIAELQQLLQRRTQELHTLSTTWEEGKRAPEHLKQALVDTQRLLHAKSQELQTRTQEVEELRRGPQLLKQALLDTQRLLQAKSQEFEAMHWTLTQELDRSRLMGDAIRRELTALQQSTAHRRLVRPLWTALVWLRAIPKYLRRPLGTLRHWERRRIVIVKPFFVSADAARVAVAQLRTRWPQARLTLLANAFANERAVLEGISEVSQKWLYGPGYRPLTWWRLLGVMAQTQWQGFAQGVLLVGDPIPGAYRKGTILLSAVTPDVSYYHVQTDTLASSNDAAAHEPSPRALSFLLRYVASWLVFGVLATGFLLIVWLPLRWRRFWHRPR